MIKKLGKIFDDNTIEYIIKDTYFTSEQNLQFPYSTDRSIRLFPDLNIDYSFLVDIINNELSGLYECWYKKLHPKSAFGGEHVYFHQESRFVNAWGMNPDNFVQCFVALSDLDYCPLVIGEWNEDLEHEKVMSQTGISKDKIKTSELVKIPKDIFKTYYLRKGEGIIFDYRTIHGSVGNSSSYDQPRAVFQLAKKGVQKDNDKIFSVAQDKLDWEINVLSKMLENRKQQKKNPIIY